MSFTNSNDYITGRKPAVYPAGCEVVAMRFPLSLATADLAAVRACGTGHQPTVIGPNNG